MKTLRELAGLVRGEVIGDGSIEISGVGSLKGAAEGEITFVVNPKHLPELKTTSAAAAIVPKGMKGPPGLSLIHVQDPYLAFIKVMDAFKVSSELPEGVHPTALLGQDVKLGKAVSIGAYVVIQDWVSIGDGSAIYPGVSVGSHTKIGNNSLIYSLVSIGEQVTIGDNVIIHSGTVIGGEGFGFVQVEGRHRRIPQLGRVIIEDNVEIGANVNIDRATLENTIVRHGTKIDSLCEIAHNVIIGQDCLIVAQTAIGGSAQIGDRVTLAARVAVTDHVKIGSDSIAAYNAGISKDVPANSIVSGYPAQEHTREKRVKAGIHRLPQLYRRVRELEKRIERLEEKQGNE
jgi:UDP-3-O-[3-hydroxymyristoyl] glucosamine N-acyltransferase